MVLSVVVPVYNEEKTIRDILQKIDAVVLPEGVEREIVVVDDCSTDGTRAQLAQVQSPHVRVFFHEQNKGKGAAVRLGLSQSQGDIVLIQDADLEYNPEEYPRLISPILQGRADVVYGSRFIGGHERRVVYFWHTVGNRFLTLLSNVCTNMNLTDMETGYKIFSRHALVQFLDRLRANRFGFEPEVTALIAKHKLRVYEVGISYHGRTYEEGKKIKVSDGIAAMWYIVKANFFS